MLMLEHDKIFRHIEKHREFIVKLCRDIIKMPTENPPGECTSLANFLKDLLRERGLHFRVYEPRKGNPNLVSTIKWGQGERNLVLNGHMDIFPVGDIRLWNLDPFSGTMKDGRIFGRGAADMKGGFTASLASFLLLNELNLDLDGVLTFMAVSDEETGGRWGTEWLLRNKPELKGDACIIGEPSGTNAVRIGEKGLCQLKIRTTGEPGHGSYGNGYNAITKMGNTFPILRALIQLQAEIPQDLESHMQAAKRQLDEISNGRGWLLEHPSMNVGIIRGGVKVNMIPVSCETEVDIRVPLGMTPERILQILEKELIEAGLDDVELELISRSIANYTSPDSELAKLVYKNVREVTGLKVPYTMTTGATDGRFFRERGVPTVIYGPPPYGMAAPNEYITIKDLITVTKVHSITAFDYLNPK